MKAITEGGGGGRTTLVITACLSRSWILSRSVPKTKKSLLVEEMINQQSAARNTSSTKQHKDIFVSCVPTRPLSRGRQTITATESGTTATTKHAILQRVFSGKENTKRVRCDTGRMHATHWFLLWILSTFTMTFAWRNSEISRYWSCRAELCASGVLDDSGLVGYFRHTWSAHTKISRRWEFPPSPYFVISFGGKMRFTCCSCLGETHLQPHGQHAHSA